MNLQSGLFGSDRSSEGEGSERLQTNYSVCWPNSDVFISASSSYIPITNEF